VSGALPARDAPYGLRPAGADDLDRAWAIYAGAMRPLTEGLLPWNEAGQRRVVADALAQGARMIVVDGSAAGWLQVRDTPCGPFLVHLYLSTEHRGRGIGSALIGGLCDRARRDGTAVALEVMVNNPARALYRRLGFAETAARRHKLRMEWRAGAEGSAGEASTDPTARA
jgi:ribosomal protein S18 acetylase RimI-like enzyme